VTFSLWATSSALFKGFGVHRGVRRLAVSEPSALPKVEPVPAIGGMLAPAPANIRHPDYGRIAVAHVENGASGRFAGLGCDVAGSFATVGEPKGQLEFVAAFASFLLVAADALPSSGEHGLQPQQPYCVPPSCRPQCSHISVPTATPWWYPQLLQRRAVSVIAPVLVVRSGSRGNCTRVTS